MKNQRYILLALAAAATTAYAAPRTAEQARVIAQRLLTERLSRNVEVSEVAAMQMRSPGDAAIGFTPFYMFNEASGKGFVMVNGSDLMPEVLGYADSGQLPATAEQLPENMQDWLNYVAAVERYLEENPDAAPLLQHAQATEPVAQLMTTTWGQDEPYNDQCPEKNNRRTVTGCMATSFSQVLNHQKFPTQMVGQYSYNDHGTTRTVDFEEITIDYDLLLDDYSRGKGTEEERAEVAKLMVNVGHALNIQYDVQSGAITAMGLRGLIENLGCTKAQALERAYYSLDEWNELIQFELRSNRPVILDGHSPEGGHSFVLDAVDADGLYHVNWGWDGMSNGYYDVSVLLPDNYGTGASASNLGFIYMQDIFVNVCDPALAGPYHTALRGSDQNSTLTASKASAAPGQKVTFSTTVLNFSPEAFVGYVGVVMMKDGEVCDRSMSTALTSIDATTLKSNRNGSYTYTSYGQKKISYSYTFPELEDGMYRLYLCAQPKDSEEYDLVHVDHNRTSYRLVYVYGDNISILGDKPEDAIFVTDWSVAHEELFTRPSVITVNLNNDGNESRALVYSLALVRPDGFEPEMAVSPTITLAPGETKSVSFDVLLNLEGQWLAEIYSQDRVSMSSRYDLVDNCTFDVALDPTQGATFTVAKKLEQITPKIYNIGEAAFKLTVNNTGATYDGAMAVRLYNSKTSTADKYLIAEICNDVAVDALVSQHEITLSGELNITSLSASKATLYARPYYLCGDEMRALSNTTVAVTIYKQEGEGIETIMMDEDADAVAYDLMGRRLQGKDASRQGLRIVNGEKQMSR